EEDTWFAGLERSSKKLKQYLKHGQTSRSALILTFIKCEYSYSILYICNSLFTQSFLRRDASGGLSQRVNLGGSPWMQSQAVGCLG
ncbi:MAG: hypothetical protein AAF651_05885, partial [Cyanobacteria bacterium P01_C01_bin.73]